MNTFPSLLHQIGLSATDCQGKTAVITGAGRGIGLACAQAFAALGARVVIAEISAEGEIAADNIRAAGGQAVFIRTDVSNINSVQELVEQTHQIYGLTDYLINNAIRIQAAAVLEMEPDLFDQIMAVNLRGTFLTCKSFLPDMLSRSSGVIINMVSTDAMPGLSAYIASKQGMVGFTQSLAAEISSSGVWAVPFAPGMVDTPGIRGVAPRLAPRLGLSADQLLAVSLHAAYEGLMPPEHAAAATAYLALHLAKENHGTLVNAYEVLERAGLIQPDSTDNPAKEPTVPIRTNPEKPSHRMVMDQLNQLVQILNETDAEFNKLPVFARPLARSGFKSKSGRSIQDWRRELETSRSNLAAIPESQIPPDAGLLPDRLTRLVVYYRGVTAETARFTRDKAVLRQIEETCQQRIAVIYELVEMLRSM